MAVVVQPGTELVSAAEPLDALVGGMKHPRSIVAGLNGPISHAEWMRSNGKRIAARKAPCGICPLEETYQIHGILRPVR